MVYDGGVKDQGGEATGNQANPSASSSKSDLDKKLGVRHPLKHKRFRAGGKKMADPTSSGVEEEEEVGTTSEGGTMPTEIVGPGGADVAAQERSDPEEEDVGYKSGGWKRYHFIVFPLSMFFSSFFFCNQEE